MLEVSETLGRADGSASWLVSVASTSNWMTGRLSVRAREEIFGANPDARVAGAGTPAPARRAHGGLRISGRWPYASGAHYADWASVVASLSDEPGKVADTLWCIVPATEMRIEKTWHTVGMRGTGSDTWVAADVFVPDYRTIPIAALTEATSPVPCEEPMHRLPLAPLATVLLVGPLLGLGRAALDFVVDAAAAKALGHTLISRQSDSVGVQIQIAQAAVGLCTARLHAYGVAAALDAAVRGGQAVGYSARAEFRARLGYAAQQIIDALSILMSVHGAASFAESNPLQQYWRDASIAARHAGLQATVGLELYGKSILGVGERISPTV